MEPNVFVSGDYPDIEINISSFNRRRKAICDLIFEHGRPKDPNENIPNFAGSAYIDNANNQILLSLAIEAKNWMVADRLIEQGAECPVGKLADPYWRNSHFRQAAGDGQ